jgi:hypothetical protein
MALKKDQQHALKGQQNLQAKHRFQSRLWKVVVFLSSESHLGVDLHSGPVGLDQPPSARHIDGVPGVTPPVVVKLVAWHVIPRLRNQEDYYINSCALSVHGLNVNICAFLLRM